MQNLKNLYTELATIVENNCPQIKWIDLWHNQVSFLETEHPFPSPAAFFAFRIAQAQDAGLKTQLLRMQVDIYLFFETFADTYKGAINQGDALDFLDSLNDIHVCLHGSKGDNYSEMRRINLSPIDTGSAANLYLLTFECMVNDDSASLHFNEETLPEAILIEKGNAPANPILNDFKLD